MEATGDVTVWLAHCEGARYQIQPHAHPPQKRI